MTILLTRCFADLLFALFLEQTVADLRFKIALKIFRESRQSLVAEPASAVEVLCAIVAMGTHVKPLNLQGSIGGLDVSLRKHLCDVHRLFKLMEMIHWQGHEVLADPVVAAWTHVDPLAVSRLFLVQGVLEKKVNQRLEVSSRGTIMLWQSYLRIDWLREVFRENPLPAT